MAKTQNELLRGYIYNFDHITNLKHGYFKVLIQKAIRKFIKEEPTKGSIDECECFALITNTRREKKGEKTKQRKECVSGFCTRCGKEAHNVDG